MMIIHLMRLGPQVVDTEAMDIMNEMFKLVTKSGTTRLKSNIPLASLLSYKDERDTKMKHKHEAVIEEMSSVSLQLIVISEGTGVV